MKKQPLPLREVLAVAVAASDVNSFEKLGYVKAAYPVNRRIFDGTVQTVAVPEGYDGVYDGEPYVFANKDIVKEFFGHKSVTYWNSEKHHIPKLNVTEETYAKADEIIKHFQKLMFSALGGQLNDYTQLIYDIIDSGEVTPRNMGIVASMPSSFERDAVNKKHQEEIDELAHTSEYIGVVGDKIEVDIKIITSKFIEKFGCYVYNASTGENAVTFWSQKAPEVFGETCRIKGKVKRTKVSDYTRAKETELNYVKVV